MRLDLQQAGAIAVAATLLTALFSAAGAAAQDQNPTALQTVSPTHFISQPVVQALPDETARDDEPDADAVDADSLPELVAVQPQPGELSRELECLAGAIYFEARGETLAGQLAVGRVIVARAKSGRFPDSYCGVVFQRSQFSFVRGNAMPRIRTGSAAWRNAVAVAQIAHSGSWNSPVEGALFFHAARVSPGWRLTRLARVDNHVFYR